MMLRDWLIGIGAVMCVVGMLMLLAEWKARKVAKLADEEMQRHISRGGRRPGDFSTQRPDQGD